MPGKLTFCISQIFSAGHLRSGQSRDLAHYKSREDNEIVHFTTYMLYSELRHICYCHTLLWCPPTLFLHLMALSYVTDDVTWVFEVVRVFRQQLPIELR